MDNKKNYAVMDGNTAAAYSAYAFTEVAAIYPITPSSPMAEKVDEWSAKGKKNLFGTTVDVIQMQSEAGAAGTCHGSLQAGALTTTFTSSQGLMLMIPAMYAMGGQFLPSVMHIASRVVTSNHHSIFGDHTDFMTCRTTGYGMLMSSSPQEAMDLAAVAHLSAIKARYAFMHCFDGFRTSHEMQRIETLDYEDLRGLVDQKALQEFRRQSLNPEHPTNRGNNVNPDIYFQCKEGANVKAEIVPDTIQHYMDEINKLTGRDYKLFNYYGAPDAEEVIVVMCSASEAVKETVDYLNAQGRKVGMVQIHLYRPFSVKHFAAAIPASVKKIAVLDRSKETGSVGEPVYLDVVTALNQAGRNDITVVGGRYGLSSKDTTPGQILAVYENLKQETPKNHFTVGIVDDVTFTSLPVLQEINTTPAGQTDAEIWGMGSDGTVGANKNSIKIIGHATDLYCQAYFVYDSKKSGGLTQSHLRFGKFPIRAPYLVTAADFVACHTPSYVHKYDMVKDLKDGGTFLLNCPWDLEGLEKNLPASMKRALAEKHAKLYTIDAISIARKLGLGSRTNTILQAAFFTLTGVIPIDQAVAEMKDAIYKTYYKKKGQAVVDMNNASIDHGINELVSVDIPESWLTVEDAPVQQEKPAFIRDVVDVMNRQEGNSLPVSTMVKYGLADGTWPAGTSKFEKRGAAVEVPTWDASKCLQCNQCALVCPHAAIRPILLDEAEESAKPVEFETVAAKGMNGKYTYRLQVSPYDCTGCGSCVNVCLAKDTAITMQSLESQVKEAENWTYAVETVTVKKDAVSDKNVKASQFAKPYFEFSGACAGCGETPYIKLVSQLFGDRMYITNASGCSSAYGGSTPSSPYCTDKKGHGPAWAMSLFEDNAEYAYGYLLGQDAIQKQLIAAVSALAADGVAQEACEAYLENGNDAAQSQAVSDALLSAIENDSSDNAVFIRNNKEFLTKKSVWAFGGDGWAYDIGYGGLDHVLASGKDINVLVLDTEVYSNTGGQASKSTAAGAIAKFAAGGKNTKKKDLGMMAMSYGYVYVAQVAMGADPAQTLKAIREAEAYPGPSLVIAYCPCIEHGMKCGMGLSQLEEKKAVECGYWHLYRYDPRLKQEGKNPFTLDSKEPSGDFQQFLMGQNRYASLKLSFPEKAQELYDKATQDAQERYSGYRRLADQH